MHWLREKPCDVTGALHHTMITVPEEAERFRIQAAKDWETLLLARAKEMASGKYKNTDPVLTSRDIFKNRDFFSVLLSVHVFGYQKRGFSIGPQSGVFVNAGLSFSCGRT